MGTSAARKEDQVKAIAARRKGIRLIRRHLRRLATTIQWQNRHWEASSRQMGASLTNVAPSVGWMSLLPAGSRQHLVALPPRGRDAGNLERIAFFQSDSGPVRTDDRSIPVDLRALRHDDDLPAPQTNTSATPAQNHPAA